MNYACLDSFVVENNNRKLEKRELERSCLDTLLNRRYPVLVYNIQEQAVIGDKWGDEWEVA